MKTPAMPTPRQQKLISIVNENLKNKNGTKTFAQMMIEAGYSKESARLPHRTMKAPIIVKSTEETVNELKVEREALIQALPKKRKSAKYHQMIDGIDKITKNVQILEGKPTEHMAVIIQLSEAIANKHTNVSTENPPKVQ